MRRALLLILLSTSVIVVLAASIFAYISLTPKPKSSGSLQLEWQQFLPGYTGNQIIQASDGGYLAVGTNASIDQITSSPDYFTTIIHKIDSLGNLMWTRTISLGSKTNTQLTHALKASDGYLLAGGVDSQGCVVKIDFEGYLLWQKTYDFLQGIDALVETSDGGCAVAGPVYPVAPTPEFQMAKVDSSGNMQWHVGYSDAPPALGISFGFSGVPSSIFQTSDQGYIIISTQTHHGVGSTPIQMFSLDANGNLEWNKTYGGMDNYYSTYVYDSLALSDGYLMVGRASPHEGQSAGFILETNLQGNVKWNNTYSYEGEISTITSVSVADDGFIFVGYAQQNPESLASDTWVAKINIEGKVLGELAIPMGNHPSSPTSLIQSSDGRYVFVGVWNQDSPNLLDQKLWIVKITE